MKMPDSQIAVTLFNLREYCKTESDLDRTLDRVCEIGYQAVQVSAVPLPAEVIKKQLDKHALFCCATHENIATISGEMVSRLPGARSASPLSLRRMRLYAFGSVSLMCGFLFGVPRIMPYRFGDGELKMCQ